MANVVEGLGVETGAEDLQRLDDAWAGPIEVAVPVRDVDVSWFRVKMTAVGVALRRIGTSPIAVTRVPGGLGASRVPLAALAGSRRP
jgi:hypothetical protein